MHKHRSPLWPLYVVPPPVSNTQRSSLSLRPPSSLVNPMLSSCAESPLEFITIVRDISMWSQRCLSEMLCSFRECSLPTTSTFPGVGSTPRSAALTPSPMKATEVEAARKAAFSSSPVGTLDTYRLYSSSQQS